MLKRCKSIKKAIQSIESAQEESLLLNNEKQIWTNKLVKFGLSYELVICITSSTQLKHESYCDSVLLLSTSIYDLVLIYVCHFHQLLLLLLHQS